MVQLSLLGSVVSNLLLVMGTAFLAGGILHPMQTFNKQVRAEGILPLGEGDVGQGIVREMVQWNAFLCPVDNSPPWQLHRAAAAGSHFSTAASGTQ